MQPLLKLTGITKSFAGIRALSNASLSVYPGKVMALVGENGAGKSTLMKILAGADRPDSGQIYYCGKPVAFSCPQASQQAGIGMVYQELSLIAELNIAENIFLGREFITVFGRIDWQRMHREAAMLLASLNLRLNSRRLVESLSISEQQMVEIARALSFKSKVIIMDEPTDSLTEQESATLFQVINKLKKTGCGIVYISHRLAEIFNVCDDVTVLRDGNFIAERSVTGLNQNMLIKMMIGHEINTASPNHGVAPVSQSELRLCVKNLSGPGVEDISFQLRRGEVLGVTGLMGAGRTELMKILCGASPRTGGEIRLDDKSIKIDSPQSGFKHGIVYISEDRKRDGLILTMSVKENMTLTRLGDFTRIDGGIRHGVERAAAFSLIRRFRIKSCSLDQSVHLLSGGNQQKVAIAHGLIAQPKVLILDEPTRGIDIAAKQEIYRLITQAKARGVSIILVSSEMPEILSLSDHILVMRNGRRAQEFINKNVNREKLIAAAMNPAQ